MQSMYILITTGHVWKSKDLRDHIGTIVAHLIYCMYVLLQCIYVCIYGFQLGGIMSFGSGICQYY